MKKLFKSLMSDSLFYLIFVISIMPLFFVEEIFSTPIYILLVAYFFLKIAYEYNLGKYPNKLLLLFDILGTLSLLFKFKFLILLRTIRIIRLVAKGKNIQILYNVFYNQREIFRSILIISFTYVILTSVLVFNIEPETFDNNYFNAFYWAGITLTTVGYGDIYPVTTIGKTVALLSSFFGIGIIALPTGIIAAEFKRSFKYKQTNEERDEWKVK